jgi:hypothetical protein
LCVARRYVLEIFQTFSSCRRAARYMGRAWARNVWERLRYGSPARSRFCVDRRRRRFWRRSVDHHRRPLRKQRLLFGYGVTPQFDSREVSSPKRSTLAVTVGPQASDFEVKAIASRTVQLVGIRPPFHSKNGLNANIYALFRMICACNWPPPLVPRPASLSGCAIKSMGYMNFGFVRIE